MANLEYRFPDMREEADAIKRMSPSQVGKLRSEALSRIEHLNRICNDYFENMIESECYFCRHEGYGYYDLPEGWGFMNQGHIICTACQDKWEKRFGKRVEINKGEVEYEHSIPEDSSHRGQANFEFV